MICILKPVVICDVCDWDPIRKRFMDDLGFPRTLDRPIKLLGTCVRYQRYVETMIGARGPDFLGGSATTTMIDFMWVSSAFHLMHYHIT
jgi:hypothetical protein